MRSIDISPSRFLTSALGISVSLIMACPCTTFGETSRAPREDLVQLEVDFGEIRAGERQCRRTGLAREGWSSPYVEMELIELPRGVRLQTLTYDGFPTYEAEQFCVKTEPWTPSHPRKAFVLHFNRSNPSRRRPDVYFAEVQASFSVRRSFGLVHVATFIWFPPLVLLIALLVRRRRPDFDRGLVLAWKIDREAGYREAGQSDWQFRPLAELVGARRRPLLQQRVALDRVLDSEANLDPVTLEPFPEQEIRVDSRLVMVVQGHDEPTARETSGELTIPSGTVVRAGRLLFVLLPSEVAESVGENRVKLPEPGGAAVEGRQSMVGGLRAHLAHRQPGLWGWLLLAFGPPLIALGFALTGLVVTATMVAALSAAIMICSVGLLQVLRRSFMARRR